MSVTVVNFCLLSRVMFQNMECMQLQVREWPSIDPRDKTPVVLKSVLPVWLLYGF